MIAFFGIPGVGKSSLAREFAALIGAKLFLEPEEEEWPNAVHDRDRCGHATAVHWFRAIRVPNLFEAQSLKMQGKRVVIDSYYDKLFHYYIGEPGMEWLISQNDPYFSNVADLARLDLALLPDTDILVSVFVGEQDWKKMLATRNRQLNHKAQLEKTYHTSELFRSAARTYAGQRPGRVRLVEFENKYGNPKTAAFDLKTLLGMDDES
jgi:deoxyadenosine/deoxycytidine kinase